MGKVYLDFTFVKSVCFSLADQIKAKFNPDVVVSINRGGATLGHIIAKKLHLPLATYFPGEKPLLTFPQNRLFSRLVFIEDLVAQGRTFYQLSSYMNYLEEGCLGIPCLNSDFKWTFVPFLLDDKAPVDIPCLTYGIRTSTWMVFPWETLEDMNEGDRGLFRDNTDTYGR